VVGVAESQPTTLRWAIDEARRFHLDLDIVHCAGFASYSTRVIDQIYFESWREAAERVLVNARTYVSHELDEPHVEYVLTDEPPIGDLLARSSDAAAIVLGADRLSRYQRVVRSAVAEVVARHAHCPVVVIPEERAPSSSSSPATIVAGIKATRPEESVLRYALEHADRNGCRLDVVHVVPFDHSAVEVEAHRELVSEAVAGWSEKFPDVSIAYSFPSGIQARVLARATKNASLVVVGQPRQTKESRATTDGLLRRAEGPVAIVPDPMRERRP
jgi:nucleotide-binding universal stress UspA family protein